MKFAVTILLLVAASQAAKVTSTRSKQNTENVEKTEKRELIEGNNGIEKRTPVLPTASPSSTAGVEYANTKESVQDKSPTQQIYATPVPQIAKISDVLTGQGPPFQAAIASHLYSPISIYQPRFPSPTTYEVSAPVPSQLAYSEHRVSVPSPNAIDYSQKPQKISKPILTNYQQPQVLVQPSYEQGHLGPIHPIFQQIPNHYQNIQPIQFNQLPQTYNVEQQQIQYLQQPIHQQSGITYVQQDQSNQGSKYQQPEQRDLKTQPAPIQFLEKQQNIQQEYNNNKQNALSYTTFTYNPATSHDQSQLQQIQPQPVQHQSEGQQQFIQPQQQQQQQQAQRQIIYQLQHPAQSQQQPQLQIQPQPQAHPQPQLQYQAQEQTQQPIHYQQQPQPQIQYQIEPQQQFLYQPFQTQHLQSQQFPQSHLQSQPQFLQQQYQLQQTQAQVFDKPEAVLSKQSVPERQIYLKQAPLLQQQYSQPIPQIQNLGYKGQPIAVPSFPPVQYFGKFAHSIFGSYHH